MASGNISSGFSKDELLLGRFKSLAKDKFVKNVLDHYQPSKSDSQNSATLAGTSSITQPHLLDTAKLLQSLHKEYPGLAEQVSITGKKPKKNDLASEIVRFIKGSRDIICLRCKEDYSPYSPENSTDAEIACFICQRPSHHGCYSDSQLDEEAGIIYVCSECKANKVTSPSTPTAELEDKAKVSADKLPAQKENTVEPQASSDGELEHDEKKKVTVKDENEKDLQSAYDRSQPVCPLLLQQECPHGITGATNGKCPNYHPTWCSKFMKNGPGGRRGCKRGDKCRYFHPALCQNGLSTNICLNKECKLIHIKGVKRVQRDKPQHGKDPKPKEKKKAVPPKKKPAASSTTPGNSKLETIPAKNASQNIQTTADPPQSAPAQAQNNNIPCPISKSDFLIHLEKMKADLSRELPAMIQTTLQSMMNFNSPQTMNRMPYPARLQFSVPEFHHVQPSPPQLLSQLHPATPSQFRQ